MGAERKASVEDPRTLVHEESGDYLGELTSSSLEKCSRTKSFSTETAFSSNELSSSTPLTAIPIDAKMPNPKPTLWYRDERFEIGEVNGQHPETKTN